MINRSRQLLSIELLSQKNLKYLILFVLVFQGFVTGWNIKSINDVRFV